MNGGIIGAVNLPTVNSAKGVWSLEELKLAQQQGIWPPLTTSDPYFRYVSLLLSGETATTNGAQNNTFLDSSSNTYTITRNGNTTQGSSTPYTNSWSSYYDGGANILSTPTSSEFNLSGGTFTLECWVYMLAYPGTPNRLIYFGPNGSQSSFVFSITPTGQVDCGVPFSTGGGANTGANVIPLRTWSHVAFVLNSNSASIYINGVRYGQSSGWNISSTNSNSLNIGYQNVPTVEGRFTGYVSNVRLVVGSALYSGSTLTVPTSPLTFVAGTKFLGCQDNRYLDNSQNNFSFTLTGIVRTTPFSPFSGFIFDTTYYSTKLDGTGDYLLTPSSANLSVANNADWTVEGWIYSTTTVNQCIFFSSNGVTDSWATNHNFGIYKNASNLLIFEFSDGSGPAYTTTPTLTIPNNTWTHFAVVYNGTNKTVTTYINGARDLNAASVSAYASPGTTPRVTIGRTDPTVPSQFTFPVTGNVSNIRLVRGSQVYSGATITVPTSPLTAISGTALLICQSSRSIDNSTNAFAITVAGDSIPTTFAPFTSPLIQNTSYTTATYGASAFFDGTGDTLTAPSGASISGTGDFTGECWVYPTAIPGSYNVVVANDTSGGIAMFAINNNGTVFFGRSLIEIQGTTSNALNFYSWNHLAISRQSGTLRLFINGVQGYSGSIGTNYNAGVVRIGSDGGGSALPYTGYLSNFRIIQGSALYTSNFAPPAVPITSISGTSLLCNFTNAGIIDSAAINDCETLGNSQVNTTVKKYGFGSYSFDGTGDGLAFSSNSVYATGTGDFTIEGWMYIISLSAVSTICATRTAAETTTGWNLAVLTNGNMQMYDNTPYAAMGAGSISAGVWYHFAFVRSSNVITSYLNGVQKASTACTRDWTQSTFWAGVTGGNSEVMNGYISDLRYTVGYARYTTNFTPPATSLPRY